MKNQKSYLLTVIFLTLFIKLNGQNYSWNQLANFGGGLRSGVSSFSIGSKGYFACGLDNLLNSYNDLWEYNPANNTWTQKASIPGLVRFSGNGFSIGNFGYICLGWESTGSNPNQLNDLWQYDPVNNSWNQKTNFPGSGRYNASVFVINTKAYVGLGYKPMHSDFYEYDSGNDSWTPLTNSFPGGYLSNAVSFSITYNSGGVYTKGYICTGSSDANGTILPNNLWEFSPGVTAGSGTWVAKANFPGNGRFGAFGFSINDKGYVGGGRDLSSGFNDFFEYDPINNTWNTKPVFPGINMSHPRAFVIGNIAYLGSGENSSGNTFFDLFWNYAPVAGINDLAGDAFSVKVFSSTDNTIKFIFSKPLDDDYDLSVINILGEKILNEKIGTGTTETELNIEKSSFENLFYTMFSDKGVIKRGKISLY